MTPYCIRGFNKTFTRFIREDVQAESQSHALRIVRQLHKDAGALACRPPKHADAVLDALVNLQPAERIAA